MKRYYEILGVGRDTPLDEVRQAYRDLVRVWHPDRFSSDYRLSRISEEKLKLINEAYREVRAHIASAPPPEQGVLFGPQRPVDPSTSTDDEYMFHFYDPDYSPWIWTYQREHAAGSAAAPVPSRSRRVAILAAGICILGLSAAAVAWHFGGTAATAVPAQPFSPPSAPISSPSPPPLPPSTGVPVVPGPGEAVVRAGGSPLGAGIRNGRSRVTMVNDTKDDAVVKLLLSGNGGSRMVRSVFLPAGNTFTATEIPPGSYLVKVALGADWDARAMRFRHPSGFAVSSGVELEEEATDRSRGDGIVVRKLLASELRVPLNTILRTRITEAEFVAD